jgi:hypothetical protein
MSVHSWRKVVLTIIFLILSIFYGVLFYQHASFNSEMMFNVAHIKSLTNIFTSPINLIIGIILAVRSTYLVLG